MIGPLNRLFKFRGPPGPPSFEYHFIHIPKNAGNSVRAALQKEGNVSMSNPLHYRYVDIVHKVGPDLKFFCVIRNPWSRTASRFKFAKQNAAKWPIDDPRRIYIQQATFSEYIMNHKIFEIPEHPGQPWMGPMNSWFNQLDWIKDESGKVMCDCLRLEHLENDLDMYFARHLDIKRRNATTQNYDYRTMYTSELIDKVADLFQEDINHFGFSFDGPATTNTVADLKART